MMTRNFLIMMKLQSPSRIKQKQKKNYLIFLKQQEQLMTCQISLLNKDIQTKNQAIIPLKNITLSNLNIRFKILTKIQIKLKKEDKDITKNWLKIWLQLEKCQPFRLMNWEMNCFIFSHNIGMNWKFKKKNSKRD